MLQFIKNLFKKKIIKKTYDVSFDFINDIKNDIDLIYLNHIDVYYDIINYLLNRYNIPLDNVYVHSDGYGGKCVTRGRLYDCKNKHEFNGQLYTFDKYKFLIIPEPTNVFSLQVCIHEIYHWHLHNKKNTNTLIEEYEAERMSKTFINKMFLGERSKTFYCDLINEYIIKNVESYEKDHNMPIYVKSYLDSIRKSVEN